MSFGARLISGAGDAHLYHVRLDGGEREFHLVLDTAGQRTLSATPEGIPDDFCEMSLETGNMEIAPGENDDYFDRETHGYSREEFSRVAAHVLTGWVRDGSPPATVVKHFG
ncbi:hypothetical protein [Streptomyces sedi]|uniref:Uncharacterized protein n=1 Tax=Streptomyces sedi TaxID=555059 RepID=A0A5C4V2W5_9ACTN|nr:hypothetical protein [Streptomyces sedi]TNM30264.1 hypothetical protein FH715_12995 [Streptomyces sedi]